MSTLFRLGHQTGNISPFPLSLPNFSAQFRPGGINDIISNTAPTPTVRMRIYKASGQEAANVDLGELLTLKIEMEQSSAFAIFARNLEARTDNGELMTLIDNVG